jgi:hypothetical protein
VEVKMTKFRRTRAVGLLCLLACATWSLSASAQYERLETTDDGYEVKFEDGHLLADSDGAKGFIIKLRSDHPRVLLIRPRANFVKEVLESVESM